MSRKIQELILGQKLFGLQAGVKFGLLEKFEMRTLYHALQNCASFFYRLFSASFADLNNHRLKPVGYCGLKAAFLRLKGALRAEALFLP